MTLHHELLDQNIKEWRRRYPARAPAWYYWRQWGMPLLLLVIAVPAGSWWMPRHPLDYWVRPAMIYMVVAIAVGLTRLLSAGIVTAAGGLVYLVIAFEMVPSSARAVDGLDWLAWHSAALAGLSGLFAIARRYTRQE